MKKKPEDNLIQCKIFSFFHNRPANNSIRKFSRHPADECIPLVHPLYKQREGGNFREEAHSKQRKSRVKLARQGEIEAELFDTAVPKFLPLSLSPQERKRRCSRKYFMSPPPRQRHSSLLGHSYLTRDGGGRDTGSSSLSLSFAYLPAGILARDLIWELR